MNKLSFKELMNIEYKYIFEYFDSPLSFIATSKRRNYLFYYIDDTSFFIAELIKNDISTLNETKNLKEFMKYLADLDKIKVVTFDFTSDQVSYLSLDEVTFDFENYFPTSDKIVDYDYNLEQDIPFNYDYADELDFPLETEDITVRISDNSNSQVYSFDVVESVMRYVKKSFDAVKIAAQNLNTQNLLMSPYTEGSFKVNFLISEDDNLLESKIDFSPILNAIDEVTVDNRELSLDLIDEELGIELVENINELYSVVKQEGVSIGFYENKESSVELAKIYTNNILENNLSVFTDKISEKNSLTTTQTEIVVPNSRFITGSLIYNSVMIEIEGITERAKFETKLFKRIKDKTQHLNLNQSITLDLTVETSIDSQGNIVKKKNIINNFRYL